MEKLNETIAANLVKLRKKANITQLELAEKMKYSDKTVSKWETGEVTPSVEVLKRLCDFYHVTLNDITKKLDDNKGISKLRKAVKRNQLIISLLAVSVVWIISTIVFVYSSVISGYNAWMAFMWAVPVSCIVGIVFNTLWGSKKANYIIISILVWTLITCIYLQFLTYNFVAIYFLGIPIQTSILLWSGLRKIKLRRIN